MITATEVRKIALSLPESIEAPHFQLVSFRVRKKIFCTLHEKDHRVMVKLSPTEQSVFCAYDKQIIYPVPGAWGLKGATFIELKKVRKAMLTDAIRMAWYLAAPKSLSKDFFTG